MRSATRPIGVLLWLAACSCGLLGLTSCGRLIPPPTATLRAAVQAIPTATALPTATRRATFTPVPATPSDTPTPTVTPTPIIYVIKKGDTLLAIARKFGTTVQELQDVNGITDPRRLRINQEIMIPLKTGEGEPTAVPTPTPVALQIEGLGFYWTPVESLWCLGEVVNLSGQPAEEVQVQISLHDEQGTLLASGAAFTQLDILASGARAPFAILFAAAPSSFAQYQSRLLSGVPSTHLGPRYPDLVVAGDSGTWLDENNYQVRGEVRNTGQADAEQVAVVVTLYGPDGHVVGARTIGIPAELFLAGATAPFEVILTPMGPVDHYDVQVQGWWVGYEIPMPTDAAPAAATP